MVQRYSFIGGPYAYADPDDKGDWVRSECYAALERERDGMQIDIVGLQSALQNQMKCVGELKEFLHNAEAANAMLRKRLEPIEAAYREYKEYPPSAIVKRDAYDKAINRCMELEEEK